LPFWHTLYQTKYAEICRIKIKINARAASVTNKSFERTTPSGLELYRRESGERLRSPNCAPSAVAAQFRRYANKYKGK